MPTKIQITPPVRIKHHGDTASFIAWAVIDRHDNIILTSIRQTAHQSINAYLKIINSGPTQTPYSWTEIQNLGYRTRKIKARYNT